MTIWERRDFPVLQALAKSTDEDLREGFLSLGGTGGKRLGLDDLADDEIHDAILTLGDAGYVEARVEYHTGGGAIFTHLRLTGRGLQALGEWPLFDEISSPETLAMLLEHLAEEAPSDEEEANLRRAARYARSVSASTLKAAAVGATSQLARIALGF